jgi:hypothetical protein
MTLIPALAVEKACGVDMISHALLGNKIIVSVSSLKDDHILHPVSDGVELPQQSLGLVAVARHADSIMGMDQVQTVLNGGFLLLI